MLPELLVSSSRRNAAFVAAFFFAAFSGVSIPASRLGRYSCGSAIKSG
jgi:hypothetical protein